MIAKRSVRMMILAVCMAVVSSLGLSSFSEATAASATASIKASASEPSSPGLSFDDSSKAKRTEPKSNVTRTDESKADFQRIKQYAESNPEDCDEIVEQLDGIQYTYYTCASAESQLTIAAHASGKAATDARGRLILSFIMPDGIPKSEQTQCKTIPAGQSYVNNYYDSTGAERWKRKVAGPGGVKICFYQGKWRVAKCGNVVLMKPPPAIRKKLVKGAVAIRQRQKIYSDAKSEAEGKSESAVKATQMTGACAGSVATATALGSFFAIARARAWAWNKQSSLIALQGEIERLQIEEQSRNEAKANSKTDARGKARTDVNALIVCNTPEQPPTYGSPSISVNPGACVYEGQQTGVVTVIVSNPNGFNDNGPVTVGSQTKNIAVGANSNASVTFSGYAPGTYPVSVKLNIANKTATSQVTVNKCESPQQEKPTLSDTKINDVEQGGFMRNYRLSYNVPSNHTGTLVVTANYGKFVLDGQACSAPAVSRFTVSGNNVLVLTYCAHADAGGPTTDTVTVTLRDETTGLSATPLTQTFATPPPSVHPGKTA